MRLVCAAIVMAALPVTVAAQTIRQSAPPPISSPAPSIGLPLPSIGLPLPSIGLPLPPLGLPPATVQPPITHRPQRFPRFVYLVPVFDWQYGYGYPGMLPPPAPQPAPEPEVVTGAFRLDVQPEKTLQVFVNGYFIGTPLDFGSELELPVGTHAIELSAPGHETIKFNVKIDGTRPITYRGSLKPIEPKPVTDVPPPPAAPSTLYYIPGCYMGNVDPKEMKLPADCDMSKLVTKKTP